MYAMHHVQSIDGPSVALRAALHDLLAKENLTALFQPVIDLRSGAVYGYEGLIRGPSDSPLHSPINLFKTARINHMTAPLERLCRKIVLDRFTNLGLPGKVFLNVSPEALTDASSTPENFGLELASQTGLRDKVIFELTENEPTYDYEQLRQAATHYRDQGFQVAIDDLGEGFSSLRLWSELRPEFVKIDMHFIHGIHTDPLKMQFVRSIQEIAEKSGSNVVAEGIETEEELKAVQALGIRFGQGYFLARPASHPPTVLPLSVSLILKDRFHVNASRLIHQGKTPTARKITRFVAIATPEMCSNQVYDQLASDGSLPVVPVIDQGKIIGLINRFRMIDRFARPFQRELFGKKSCRHLMDTDPLIVDADTSLQELSNLIVSSDPQHLTNGFAVIENGRYLGIGTGHDLMREITELQITAARYANPLTQLPGNVPIDETIERHLLNGDEFAVCYVDLDYFKPFNDLYGYRKGDEVIRTTANILRHHCDPVSDFVGHIGGDDFIVVFASADWQARCNGMLNDFTEETGGMYIEEHRRNQGYTTLDRRGKAFSTRSSACRSASFVSTRRTTARRTTSPLRQPKPRNRRSARPETACSSSAVRWAADGSQRPARKPWPSDATAPTRACRVTDASPR